MNMSFTSFEFWVFFAAVFTAMHALMPWLSQKTSASVTRNLRQGALLLLSVAFYVMAAGHLVILILASIAANHAMAHVISRAHGFWRAVSTSVPAGGCRWAYTLSAWVQSADLCLKAALPHWLCAHPA